MKRLYLIGCLCCMVIGMMAQTPQYTQEDSVRVVELLRKAYSDTAGVEKTPGALMLRIGRYVRDMNIPYVAHTLEPNDKERLIVNLREMDCTTFTETVTALTLCVCNGLDSFEAYCHILQKIRYEQGDVPQYIKRLHYFTSWIEDNEQMGFVHEIQSPNPPFTALQTIQVDYMTQHVDKYRMLAAHLEDVPAIREMEQAINGKKYRYIPKEKLTNTPLLRETIHDGDIIAIITNIKGLDTQHIGIAAWHQDGLHLLNASSIHKRVVEEPMTLRQYLFKHKTMPGIRIIRLRNPNNETE